MKNFIIRAITGIVFVALLVIATCLNPFTFAAFFSLLLMLAMYEYNKLVKIDRALIRISNVLGGVYLFLSVFFFSGGYIGYMVFFPYILFIIALLFIELYNKNGHLLEEVGACLGGQIYIAAFISVANLLVFTPSLSEQTTQFTPYNLLAVFVVIWLNDTGAYLIGSTMGKHRLFERISPKKSWEGFFGGIIISVLAAYFIAPYIHVDQIAAVGFALLISLVATMGDLVESMVKRIANVKDAGNILPGHGGILDRIDGAIPSIPVAYMFIELFIRN